MEVITFDSEAYKKLEGKINVIFNYIITSTKQVSETEEGNPKTEEKAIRLFNSKEVCKMLDVCKRTLLRMRVKGEISFIRVGGRIRFRQTDIDNYIEYRKIQARNQN